MSPLTKKLSWALAISLGLNLFFLGFGVARRVPHPPPPPAPTHFDPRHDMGPGPRQWFGPHAPALREQHRAFKQARRAVADALSAEPFDAQALERALADFRKATAEGQEALHRALVERAKELSPEERRKLARGPFFR